MIKVVFIDVDNTLLSFFEFVKEVLKSGFEKFGLKPYEESIFYTFIRTNDELWGRLEKGELTQEQIGELRWKMIFEELGIDFDGNTFEKYFKEQMSISTILEPGAREFLQYLSDKYILCAASNGPYKMQMKRLQKADMSPYLKHFFISEKVGAEKPSRQFFEYAFEELHQAGVTELKPEETMIIGDSLTSDMAGGKGYGMQTCFYTRGRKLESKPENVDYVIGKLTDIKEIL